MPLAWLALSRLRVEQEKAYDDEALAVCTDRARYAELLLRLGASAQKPSLLALLSAQAAGIRTLEERIRSIMHGPGRRARGRRPLPALLFAGITIVFVPLSMMRCTPAPISPTSAKEAAASSLPKARLELGWKSGTITLAADDTLTTDDFPTRWPIGPADTSPQKRHGSIVGVFRDTPNPLKERTYAHGIDIGGQAGGPVVAAGKGTVREAGLTTDYGNYVIIGHKSGFSTLYGNLREASPLKSGDVVAAGQQVGALGSTGSVTAPRIHFAVFLESEAVDPREILDGTMKAISIATTPSPLGGVIFSSLRADVDHFSGTAFNPDSVSTSTILQWPTKDGVGVITNRFSAWISPFTRRASFHAGIDIAWAEGWDIVAALPGTVTETGFDDQEGNFVRIVGGTFPVGTYYSHVASVKVTKGETVAEGQAIAILGSTGLSTGPHVHFEVTYNGVTVDPLQLLPPESTLGRGSLHGRYSRF